jgi:drug/metabolite transporter (DMT)-like permease
VLAASERGRRSAAGASWALLAAAVFGVTFLLYAHADAIAPVSAVAVSRVVALAIVLPLLLVRRGALLPRPSLRRLAPLPGLCEAFGLILSATALTSGSVAVASVMIAQFATFAVILGLVVFRERPAAHQLAGVALTIAAVTALGLA